MNLRTLWRVFIKVTVSLLCAGISYSVWLAAFLVAAELGSSVVETIGWLSAPVATAVGFAIGITIFECVTRARRTSFLRIFAWPLIGCALGAGAVYWFGPMLIVFGMFALGTASVALREMVLIIRKDRN